MRTKRHNIVCLIIAVITVISGMCFDNSKADSVLAYASFEEAVFDDAAAVIKAADASIGDIMVCTPLMQGVRDTAGIERSVYRLSVSKREAKVSLDFLCSDIFSLYFGKFAGNRDRAQDSVSGSGELITDYIHRSDGKKKLKII